MGVVGGKLPSVCNPCTHATGGGGLGRGGVGGNHLTFGNSEATSGSFKRVCACA